MESNDIIIGLRDHFYLYAGLEGQEISGNVNKLLEDTLRMALVAGFDIGRSLPDDNARPVIMMTQFGKPIQHFLSIKAAANQLGKSDCSNIVHALNGRQNTAYGYTWAYDDEVHV